MKHKVFISYHHQNDQWYKNELVRLGEANDIFIDCSVELGEIPDDWDAQKIREYIRDQHLGETTVTILLVGTETKNRKHVDWEIYSSMYDGKINKKSGILVVHLPSTNCKNHTLCSPEEKAAVLPNEKNWISIDERTKYESRYPYLPDRIIDNLLEKDVNISIVNWDDLDISILKLLIDKAFEYRKLNNYDLSRQMKMRNS